MENGLSHHRHFFIAVCRRKPAFRRWILPNYGNNINDKAVVGSVKVLSDTDISAKITRIETKLDELSKRIEEVSRKIDGVNRYIYDVFRSMTSR